MHAGLSQGASAVSEGLTPAPLRRGRAPGQPGYSRVQAAEGGSCTAL